MGANNIRNEIGAGIGFVAGLMAGTIVGMGVGSLAVQRIGSKLCGEEVTDRRRRSPRPEDPLTETSLEREETIEALLHPDRSRHGELGVTEDMKPRRRVGRSSPREQSAAPIDITKVGE
jgi:hypothetical protein